MTNVIRPTFGRRTDASPDTVEDFSPLQVYGTANGHFVALIRAETGDEGQTLQIIVGLEGGEGAESVAIFPDNAEGEADAEATAFAILRSLEIVKEAMVGTLPVAQPFVFFSGSKLVSRDCRPSAEVCRILFHRMSLSALRY